MVNNIQMWFPVSTIAMLCIIFNVSSKEVGKDIEMEFRERSQSDWEQAWHKEKYPRCRETLVKHLYWACEKDIYRLKRRNFSNYPRKFSNDFAFPLITPKRAKKFLRLRRGRIVGPTSITSECCKSTGCTWEEYAEYCPTNKRITSFI